MFNGKLACSCLAKSGSGGLVGKCQELKPIWHAGKTKAVVEAGSATVPLLLMATARIHNITPSYAVVVL